VSPWRVALLAAEAAGGWLIRKDAVRARIEEPLGRQRADDDAKRSMDDESNPS
jgi:hypothetical protein